MEPLRSTAPPQSIRERRAGSSRRRDVPGFQALTPLSSTPSSRTSAATASDALSRPWTPETTPTVLQPGSPSPSRPGDTSSLPRCSSNRVKGVDVEDLSRRYGAMVLRRCRRLLGDESEALDASQDVFVRLL